MNIRLTAPIRLDLHLGILIFTLLGSQAVRAPDPFTRITSGPVEVPAASTNRFVETLLPADDGLAPKIFRLVCPHQP